jgi:hypothetical protein
MQRPLFFSCAQRAPFGGRLAMRDVTGINWVAQEVGGNLGGMSFVNRYRTQASMRLCGHRVTPSLAERRQQSPPDTKKPRSRGFFVRERFSPARPPVLDRRRKPRWSMVTGKGAVQRLRRFAKSCRSPFGPPSKRPSSAGRRAGAFGQARRGWDLTKATSRARIQNPRNCFALGRPMRSPSRPSGRTSSRPVTRAKNSRRAGGLWPVMVACPHALLYG